MNHRWLVPVLMGAGLFPFSSTAQLPNAWQITDNSTLGGTSLVYSKNLTEQQRTDAKSKGFRYTASVRLLSDNPGTKTMALGYGMGDTRFLVWLDLDANGDLTVGLDGGQTYTVTTNGTGASAYHTHEFFFNGNVAAYRVDGHTLTTTWPGSGNSLADGQIRWGAGSSSGTGSMNVQWVRFEVEEAGLAASYDAGTSGSPVTTPDPVTLGWSANMATTNATGVSPDSVAIPSPASVTTLAATGLNPRGATLGGSVNTGGSLASTWFEWGTSTAYGNTTPAQNLKGDTSTMDQTMDIDGLLGGTTYHYRMNAYNLYGRSVGEDVEFTIPDSVTTLANSGEGSLRQAIANSVAGDTITFGTFPADSTITLTSGELMIDKNLTITGPGPANLAISGNNASGVFKIIAGKVVEISGLTIKNGSSGEGGGIYSEGQLTIHDSVLTGNRANFKGGGIGLRNAQLNMDRVTFTTNSSGFDGGALDTGNSTVTIRQCRFTGNHTETHNGGAIHGGGNILIAETIFDSNQSGLRGGAIHHDLGTMSLINSTLSENSAADHGGAIAVEGLGTLDLTNVTITANTADSDGDAAQDAGGIHSPSGSVSIRNTIVAGNKATNSTNADVFGDFRSSGFNLIGDTTGSSGWTFDDLINVNPLLAPLGDYGGLTRTTPPLAGSPAIDAGDDSVTDLPDDDQRGYPRTSGAHVDIGAVEYQLAAGIEPTALSNTSVQPDGSVGFDFDNVPDIDFTVVASTNVELPLIQWIPIGLMSQGDPGEYHFIDPQSTNYPARFYRVVTP